MVVSRHNIVSDLEQLLLAVFFFFWSLNEAKKEGSVQYLLTDSTTLGTIVFPASLSMLGLLIGGINRSGIGS